MSLSFGSSKKKTTSSQQTDPWEPAIPALTQLISQIQDQQGNVGATGGQEEAFKQLFQNASAGNPFAGDTYNLAQDLYNTESQSPTVKAAYDRLQNQIGDTASGKYLDVNENPYLQSLLQTVGDDITNRVNAQFAGAGRDLSGKNQQSLARGISEGTLPALFNQYNLERQNQSNAANTLFGAGVNTGTTVQGLDTASFLDRLRGVDASNSYLDQLNYGPNQTLQLEQQLKQLPIEDLGRIEALLGPLGQAGSQQSGQSTTKGSSLGIGAQNVFGGLGSLFSSLGISDEREKEDEEVIGEMADGTPIYRFRYSADPDGKVQIGVMAQDVEEDQPDAVSEAFGGMKMVDYDKATRRSASMMRGGY